MYILGNSMVITLMTNGKENYHSDHFLLYKNLKFFWAVEHLKLI